MADSAGPAGDTVQVAPEHSPRVSSREKTPVEAPSFSRMLHAIRWLSKNIPKNGSVLLQKTIGVRINEPSFLGGTRRLRARLSLPNQVVRARTRAVLMEVEQKHFASVIELVRRAIALTGNASYCALVDRRKGLLAKVSSGSLDLIDDPELFVPDSSDLFGKKS